MWPEVERNVLRRQLVAPHTGGLIITAVNSFRRSLHSIWAAMCWRYLVLLPKKEN